MNARRVAGQDDAQAVRLRPVAHRPTVLNSPTGVQHAQIDAACQATEHGLHLRQDEADLLHVGATEGVRHACRVGQAVHVVLRGLVLLPHRQPLLHEELRGPAADRQQFLHRESLQGVSPGGQATAQVPGDEPRIRLADRGHRIATRHVRQIAGVEAPVALSEAQKRQMHRQ